MSVWVALLTVTSPEESGNVNTSFSSPSVCVRTVLFVTPTNSKPLSRKRTDVVRDVPDLWKGVYNVKENTTIIVYTF